MLPAILQPINRHDSYLFHLFHLFLVCFAQVYRERIAGTATVAFTASPVAAGDKIYFPSEDGEVYVVKAGPKFELLATNDMGEVLMATPAIVDGTILVRGRHHLFAIGEAKKPAEKPAAK